MSSLLPDTSRPWGILIHRTEGGMTGVEVDAHEAQAQCGYHYFVRKCGAVDRLHDWPTVVWHALAWSKHCIGVAVYGDFDPREGSVNATPSEAQYLSVGALCASLYLRYGPLPILGHTDLPHATAYPDKRCPGTNLDLRRVQSLALADYRQLVKSK